MFHVYRGVPFTIEISCNRLEGISLLPELLNALTRFIDKLNGLEDAGGRPPHPQKPVNGQEA